MFKKLFLLLSIFILFYGCVNKKKKDENSVNIANSVFKDILNNEKEKIEYTIKTILGDSYYESSKELYNPNMDKLISLVNLFSQDELSELIEGIRINFYSLGIDETDLLFLEYFPYLKRLKIIGGKNVNIEGLKYLRNLEELELSHITIYNISSISNLVSLKTLKLYGLIEIKDLSPISSLNSLESLYLWDLVSVNDISVISNLINLEYLEINNIMQSRYIWNSIENFNPIFELINLRHLDFAYVRKGKDITNIKKLIKLESLRINIYNQAELDIISYLPQLRILEISSGNFNDVTPLLRLNKLEDIDFNSCSYHDIMPLAASKSLKNIQMDFGPEKWYEFLDNGYELFKKNNIEVHPYDWR